MELRLVDGILPLVLGLYFSLLAFRVVGPRPGQNAKWDAWHARYGQALKVLGPLVTLFGALVVVQHLLR